MKKLLFVLLASVVFGLGVPSANAQAWLSSGYNLWANQVLVSDNGYYGLVMQGDGNLVLYACYATTPCPRHAIWATGTSGGNPRAAMQSDANFVVYAGNSPRWASNTAGQASPYNSYVVVQNDGNVVVYKTAPGFGALWASGTAGRY